MNIPEDVMKLAHSIAMDLFANAVDSDDDSHSLDTPVAADIIARAILTDREARTGWHSHDGMRLLNEALDGLWKEAETAYCQGLDRLQRPECLGWEAKVANGSFGRVEFEAHRNAKELIGRHFGIAHAVKAIRAILSAAPSPSLRETEGDKDTGCGPADMTATDAARSTGYRDGYNAASALLLEAERALVQIIAQNQTREFMGDDANDGYGNQGWVTRDGQYAKIARSTLAKIRGRG